MNNYSLGGFDPSLVEQIYNYVQPSPFATSAMRDPSLLGQTSEMMTRLAYPNDKLAPPTQVDISMPTGQPEHDAMDVIGAIFKAPFRLIGAAKNGLEEAIGHPNADRRAMQDDYLQMMERLALTSGALTTQQKAMLFPQWYAQDREAMAAAQTGGDATATGRNTSDFPLPTPRKPGVLEWIMGDAQKENARRLATIKAMQGAVAMNQDAATLDKTRMEGFEKFAGGRKLLLEGNEVAPNNAVWRAVREAERKKELASAGAEGARGGLYRAQTSGEYQKQRQSDEAFYPEQQRKELAFDQWYDQSGRGFEQNLDQNRRQFRLNYEQSVEKHGADMTKAAGDEDRAQRSTDTWIAANDGTKPKLSSPSEMMTAETGRAAAAFKALKEDRPAEEVAGAFGYDLKDPSWKQTVFDYLLGPLYTPGREVDFNKRVPGADNSADFNRVYMLLKSTWHGSDGALTSRAREVAAIYPTLDTSSERAFAISSKNAGLSPQEGQALWKGRE